MVAARKDKLQVFLFAVDRGHFADLSESEGQPEEDLKYFLAGWAKNLIEGIEALVSEEGEFFLIDQLTSVPKPCVVTRDSVWDIILSDCDRYVTTTAKIGDFIFVIAILPVKTKSVRKSSWEKKFAKLSGWVSGTLNVIGWDESASTLVRQGYYEGGLDTGIIVSPETKDVYSGQFMQNQFGVSIDLFNIDQYLSDDPH